MGYHKDHFNNFAHDTSTNRSLHFEHGLINLQYNVTHCRVHKRSGHSHTSLIPRILVSIHVFLVKRKVTNFGSINGLMNHPKSARREKKKVETDHLGTFRIT